jgi:hypothetical protein
MIFIHTWHRGYIWGRNREVALRALRVRCVLDVKHFSQRAQRLSGYTKRTKAGFFSIHGIAMVPVLISRLNRC